ncbi:MAG: hypothetical protein M0015_01190 [Betaproteobacteria bacterium]|nr:hypothetical protein [Betaproteobacteria bacterium]
MTAKKKASRKHKPFWERGYMGHVYWLGKQKLGKVTLQGGQRAGDPGRYLWEAAGRQGRSESLEKAKSAVELAVAMADKQMDLFSG